MVTKLTVNDYSKVCSRVHTLYNLLKFYQTYYVYHITDREYELHINCRQGYGTDRQLDGWTEKLRDRQTAREGQI